MKEIAQLDQSTKLKGKRRFILGDDGVLHVSHIEAGRLQEFSVEIAQLNPEPIRDKRRDSSMIVGMSIFGLITGALVLASIGPGHSRGAELPCLALSALFLLPFLLCLYSYLKQSYDILIFQSPFTGDRVVFLKDVPSVETFVRFIDRLRSEINIHRGKLPSMPKSLSQELEALAKLRENGVLNEAEFTTAKRNLINSAKGAGAIGF